jgi:outer membrane protein assembly factor BamB
MFRSGYDPATPPFTGVTLNWKSTTLDGDVYAEPLIVGTEVVVATEENSLYELNATTGKILWHINFGTPVNGAVLPCGDINPSGITSTPVIDVAGRTIFVVAFLSSPSLHHQLFAVDLDTGAVEFQMGIDPPGSNPLYQQQRAALALSNGYVYVGYGGLDGDCGPYHGRLAATNTNGGGPVIGYQVPTGNAGAIWGGGDGPVVDQSGNILVATGNSFSTTIFDYGDAVLKLSPATSPPISLVDYFAPSNWATLNGGDLDLGSTEPVTLSSSYIFQIGKEGVGYILNANNLGHIGGQLYSSQVCTDSGGAYGGLAYSSPYLIVPCDNGLVALNVNLGSTPSFTVAWRGPSFLAGPPIIAGNAVWDVDAGNGMIYALSLSSGQTLFHGTIGTTPTHFNSVSAGDGQIFVTASRQVLAYLQQTLSIGYGDFLVWRPSSATWYDLSRGGVFTYQSFGGSGDVPLVGDVDGDGKPDAILYRPTTGQWLILTSSSNYNPSSARTINWGGVSGDIPLVGDMSGNGRADLIIYRPSTGVWYILLSSIGYTGYKTVSWGGVPGDIPLVGDVSGNGRSDLIIYRPSQGIWYILLSSTGYTGYRAIGWGGVSGDVPLVGSVSGNGRSDLIIYRPSQGIWYILLSSTGYSGYRAITWGGVSGDIPLVADYDGDGRADLAIFRSGTWYVLTSSTNYTGYITKSFGAAGDVPIPVNKT